jgi:hypothetical protein
VSVLHVIYCFELDWVSMVDNRLRKIATNILCGNVQSMMRML